MVSSPSSTAPRWDRRTWALLAALGGVVFRPAIAAVTGLAALGLLVATIGLIPAARDRLARAEN